MDTTTNEKAMRLHDILKEALTPMTEKLEKNGTRNKNFKGKPSGTKEVINGKDL